MKVEINSKQINIDDKMLNYYTYYFGIWDNPERDHLQVFKSVIKQWALALDNIKSESETLFLPYSLDDEVIECLKVTKQDEKIILQCITVDGNGYAVNLDDL